MEEVVRPGRGRFGIVGAAALVVVTAACGPPSEVQLGGVAEDGVTFAPLEGDQPLVPGSQGGFHVWVKLRFTGFEPGKHTVQRTARRTRDERLVLTTRTGIAVGEPDASGTWETPDPLPSFMCPAPIGVSVIDEPIRFEVEVLDEAGQAVAHDGAVATPHCPEGEQAQFCQQICSG
ncbi:MAG: hypothetical protein IRZ16_16970 [Myxococcaceae bacterium]|nr:hypothetical protein [Myxococcaceae bacterium]